MALRNIGCTFQWKIKKVNQLGWFQKGIKIESPTFIEDEYSNTKWSIRFYPMGNDDANDDAKNVVNLYLQRKRDCNGPDFIQVTFKLELRCENSPIWTKRTVRKKRFAKNESYGVCKMFIRRKAFLPGDTVTIRCEIRGHTTLPSDKRLKLSYALTEFRRFDRFFVWKIDKFNTLKSSLQNELKVGFFDFALDISGDEGSETKIIINLNSLGKRMNFFSFRASIVDSKGEKEELGRQIYYPNDFMKGVLSYAPQGLLEHLTNDVLSLECQYTYSVEIMSSKFHVREAEASNGIKMRDVLSMETREKYESTSVLTDAFKSVYSEGIWSDFQLRTMTHTFKAHKSILSAWSPVFRRMFSSSMMEQNSGYVEISDLEDDTIHRMLLYMYTGSMEDLHFVSVSKLYAAADKYEVLDLREKCSSFLKTKLWPTTVCDILILANLHQDKDLEVAAHTYIMKNEDVFMSVEWEGLMKLNPNLATDVLYKMFYPNQI